MESYWNIVERGEDRNDVDRGQALVRLSLASNTASELPTDEHYRDGDSDDNNIKRSNCKLYCDIKYQVEVEVLIETQNPLPHNVYCCW